MQLGGVIGLIRRRPDFRRLWLGDLVSLCGDWLTYVATSVLAVESGDGVIAVAMVMVAHNLPIAVLAPFAGPICDRFDRRTVMVGANLVQAAATVAMAASAVFGMIGLLQIFLLARVAISSFFLAAQGAAVPRTVEKEEIALANAITSGTWSVMFALGVALGAVLVAIVDPITAIVIDAATFLLAAAILAKLPALPPLRDAEDRGRSELGEAWRYARERPALLHALLCKAPLALAAGGGWVLLVAGRGAGAIEASSPEGAVAASALGIGALQLARAIGTGVGPLIDVELGRRGVTPNMLIWTSAGSVFGGIAVLIVSSGTTAALFASLIWGIGAGANWVQSTTKIQVEAPDRVLGRLSALDYLAFSAAQSASALIAAVLADRTGSLTLGATSTLAMGLLGYAALFLLAQPRTTVRVRA